MVEYLHCNLHHLRRCSILGIALQKQLVGDDIVLNGNCLSIWNSAGFKNSVTEFVLEEEKTNDGNALARRTQYDTTVNRLERLSERITGALLHDPFVIDEAIITDGVGGHLQHKPGYMQSLISPFYTHVPAGTEPDGSPAFQNVRTGNNPYQTPDPAPYYHIGTRFVNDFTEGTPATDALLIAYEQQTSQFANDQVYYDEFTDELEDLEEELANMNLQLQVLDEEEDEKQDLLEPFEEQVALLADYTAQRQALIDAGGTPTDPAVVLLDNYIAVQQNIVDLQETDRLAAEAAAEAVGDALIAQAAEIADKETEITDKQAEIDDVNQPSKEAGYEAAMVILTDELALLVTAFATAQQNYLALSEQLAEMDPGDPGYGAVQAQVAAAFTLYQDALAARDNKQGEILALEGIVLTTHGAILPWLKLQSRDYPELFFLDTDGLVEWTIVTPRYYSLDSGAVLDEWITDIATDLATDLPLAGDDYDHGWGGIEPLVHCHEHPDTYCPNKYTIVKQFLSAYQDRNRHDWILEACEGVLEGFIAGCFHVAENDVHIDDPITKVDLRRCRATGLSFEESLLTLAGTSIFQPSSIYPVVPEFPPIMQDFEFATAEFAKYYRTDKFCKYSDLVGVFDPQPEVNYSLGTVSKNVFRQEDKSLQTINMRVPIFETFSEQFTPSTVADTRYVVPFSTVQGPPSWCFICVERVEQADSLYTSYPIQITSLQLEVMSQDVKTFSTLSEFRLQEATKRNSNLRSDQRALALETGGGPTFERRLLPIC